MADLKDIFDMVQSGTTALALVVGGVWTYKIFVQQRQKYPRASLALQVADRRASDGRIILSIAAELKNIGSTLIRVQQVEVSVQRLEPIRSDLHKKMLDEHPATDSQAPCELPWYLVGHRR